jgi:hypothetical protein
MAIVIDLDQRDSTAWADLVAPYAEMLNSAFRDALQLPFVRTTGDEMQGVLGDPSRLNELLDDVSDRRDWWIGIGIGAITRAGVSSRESAGPAFKAARAAIDAAKRNRAAAGAAVCGEPADHAESLQAALAGIAFIRAKRTERQREVVATARRVPAQRTAAEQLGITQQAVSDALRAAGYDAENQLRGLASRLAAQVIAF